MNDINKTTATQINSRELNMAKFKLAYDDKKNTLIISRGVKTLTIQYNSLDLYDLTKYKKFNVIDKINGVYDDMLQNIISDFFKFEYVMEGIINGGKP